jgi:hypothetical protein
MMRFSAAQTRIVLNDWQEIEAAIGIDKFVSKFNLVPISREVVGETVHIAQDSASVSYVRTTRVQPYSVEEYVL